MCYLHHPHCCAADFVKTAKRIEVVAAVVGSTTMMLVEFLPVAVLELEQPALAKTPTEHGGLVEAGVLFVDDLETTRILARGAADWLSVE